MNQNDEVSKKAKFRHQCSQVPNLTQDTTWESDKKTQENIIYKGAKMLALSQQVTARLQWTDKKAWQTLNINNKNDTQKKHRLWTVSIKIFLLAGLN